jgi:putative nucleotidyltransferase with HDIG domain
MKHNRHIGRLIRAISGDPKLPWVILLLIATAFIVIIYPGLIVPETAYKLGDVAERNIKAPRDFLVEDTSATELNRIQAEEDVLTVYDLDPTLAGTISASVQAAFEEMRQAQTAIRTPAASPLQSLAPAAVKEPPPPATEAADGDPESFRRRHVTEMKSAFEEKLGIDLDRRVFDALLDAGFSEEISESITKMLPEIMGRGIVANKDILLRESGRGIQLRTVGTGIERTVLDFSRFSGLAQARSSVRTLSQPTLESMDYTRQRLVIDLIQRLVQPTITLNRNETEERKKAAAADTKPVLHKIKAGEMLLREGERVSEFHLLKLKALQAERRGGQVLATSLGAALLLVCFLVATFVLHSQLKGPGHRATNRDLLFVASVIILFFIVGEVSASLADALTSRADLPFSAESIGYITPVAAATMLICLFLGLQTALHVTGILAVGFAIIFHGSFDMVVFTLTGSAMAAFWVKDCRERKIFAKAGMKTGLLNMAVITAIAIYHADVSFPRLGWDWTFGLIGGLLSCILAAGIAPLAEILFGYSSDIKLLELANLDQPMMRKLMIEAPGTYHHSVIVGSMVEAAASEIGANPLLGKVCGYYHDIGKIKKPAYFIENQSGRNRHDKLAPSMSALILIAHIKDGVEIARQHKLGGVIIDTISQHHGTSLIRFFYEKAKSLKGEDNVNMDHFRYPGPKPQTREAGLVMLADVVEAASRTLDNPTPSRIQGMVQNLVKTVFSDGQLDNCELTLKDLHSIAKVFNKILTGIHHHRVEYPERRSTANGKAKQRDGHSDRQSAKQGNDRSSDIAGDRSANLRRLGLS